MSERKNWKMPKWMEPYREFLAGGSRAEELMSGPRATVQVNAPLAFIQMGMESEIGLLERLHTAKLLAEHQQPAPEGERE